MRSGLEIADKYGQKTYAMAKPAGLKIYQNLNFKIVETVSTDYAQYGGTAPYVHHLMVREPASEM